MVAPTLRLLAPDAAAGAAWAAVVGLAAAGAEAAAAAGGWVGGGPLGGGPLGAAPPPLDCWQAASNEPTAIPPPARPRPRRKRRREIGSEIIRVVLPRRSVSERQGRGLARPAQLARLRRSDAARLLSSSARTELPRQKEPRGD